MSRVRIPPVLRDVVGGSRELVANGSTVSAVLDELFGAQPALRDRICEDGRLSSFVNVYVNDTDIRHREGFDTKVDGDDVVILLPAMAGGSVDGSPSAALDRCDTVGPWSRWRPEWAAPNASVAGEENLVGIATGAPFDRRATAPDRSTRQSA